MTSNVLRLLKCAECGQDGLHSRSFDAASEGHLEEAVVWCGACRRWYPVRGGVLELLPSPLAYHHDRAAFWAEHVDELRTLNLEADHATTDRRELAAQASQQRHFDWYAINTSQSYNAYEQTPFWQAVDDITFADWRQRIAPGSWVLDVGCAQGRSSSRLMDLDVNIVGFDVSKALVQQAYARYARQNTRARAMFFVGDASQLAFVDGSFDYVIVYGVLHHLVDPEKTCLEIARVLKPGGMYFGLENNVTMFRRAFDFIQRWWPIWHEEAGAKPLMSAKEVRGWFAAAGMEVSAHSSVFVPPHLANQVSPAAARRLIAGTDAVARALPVFEHQGGLLVATASKPA